MPPDDTAPTEETIAAYLRGDLSPEDRARLEAAIDRDPQWLAVVALLARGAGAAPRSDAAAEGDDDGPEGPPLEPSADHDGSTVARVEREHAARLRTGDRLGRYIVEEPLGRGGMGMVYAALDPELGRRVAIKILRGADAGAQTRLLREARALARLSDRHVITIHDVGTWEGRVFLAMERLEGATLTQWRQQQPRTWREVLTTYVDAGRGLAAAHAAGLVHRDFKPSNVMLTLDGRVVVLDFGLASAVGSEAGFDDDTSTGDATLTDGGEPLTRTGQLLGTPAYMAPEQRRGEPCGPRSDQFSYCVALYEALHGRLPAEATDPGRTSAFEPVAGAVPRRVTRLLAIGLSVDPAERHPSQEQLVDALAAVLRPRVRWWGLAAAAGLGGAVATWVVLDESPTPSGPAPCTGAGAAMAATWNDARATAVDRALGAPRLPWSEAVRTRAGDELQRYADEWIAEHEATCWATRVDGQQSEAVLDLRMLCLDRRRRSFDALVRVLSEADTEVASQAVQSVQALPQLAACRDVEALQMPVPLPDDPTQRAAVEALFDRIATIDVLRRSKRLDDASTMADEAVASAVALGHAPTEADARLAAGWVLTDRGEHDAAETQLRAALHAAEVGRHDHATVLAWNRLAWVVGYKLARYDEGRRLAQHAQAWSERLGHSRYDEVSRLRTLGWIEHEAGNAALSLERFDASVAEAEALPEDDPVRNEELALSLNGRGAAALLAADIDTAADSFARAAGLLETSLGTDHPDVAMVHNNLATLLRAQGKGEDAHRLLDHNLGVFSSTYGDRHPLVGQTLINLAVIDLDLGRHADVERYAERAIEVLTAAHDARHPLVAKAHTLRGDARVQLGRGLEAIEDLELALSIENEVLGPEHPSVGIIESNLGGAYYELGRLPEAAEHQRRSIAILEKGLGPDHPNVAFVLVSLGLTLRLQGQHEEALVHLRRASTIGDPTVKPNAFMRIGEVLVAHGEVDEGIAALEQALRLYQEIEYDPGFVGDAQRAMSQARWAAGEHELARAAARAAIEAYQAGGDTEPEAEVRAWLAEHAPDASRPPK